MTLSMYQASVPVIVHNLKNLSALLKKAEDFATAKKIDPSVLINARLAPDMFPLSRQVQIACDVTRRGVGRLADVEAPSYEDTEKTFAELQERIANNIKFVESLKPEQIDGTESKVVNLKVGGNDMTFAGQPYLLNFVLPNLFFHVSVAYGILRHNGVDLGKKDYLGAIQ